MELVLSVHKFVDIWHWGGQWWNGFIFGESR